MADGSLRVDVTDHGPGVARDAMPRLFEPFFRGAGAQRGGSGLGLAVARGLVEAHGGRIWAENRPGGRRASASRSRRYGAAMSEARRARRPHPVIDDEPALRRAVERNLAGHGFEVRGAETGEEGLSLETRSHPDLVLLDLGAAGYPGTRSSQRLRERSSLPIIVLSVREARATRCAPWSSAPTTT